MNLDQFLSFSNLLSIAIREQEVGWHQREHQRSQMNVMTVHEKATIEWQTAFAEALTVKSFLNKRQIPKMWSTDCFSDV